MGYDPLRCPLRSCWSLARIPTTSRLAWAARSPGTRRAARASVSATSRAASWAATARPTNAWRRPRRRRTCSAPRGASTFAARRRSLAGPDQVDAIIDLIRRARPAVVAIPHGTDRHPDHVAAHALLLRALFDAGLRRFVPGLEPWRPSRVFSYFINDTGRPTFVVDVTDVYERKREALACYRSQFAPDARGAVPTRLTSPLFAQLVESRDRQFGAMAGVRCGRGLRRHAIRSGSTTCSPLWRQRRHAGAAAVNIGIVCYASVGGSGVVATELASALAERGHEVHVLSSEAPFRLRDKPRLTFHRVETPSYPLFREPQYVLSLANKIVQVARAQALDIVHAHYAIPHAAAAYLARQIIADSGRPAPASSPRCTAPTSRSSAAIPVVHRDGRLLHRAVGRGDGGVREPQGGHLPRARRDAARSRCIPNFLDCERTRGGRPASCGSSCCSGADHLVVHMSNFRPVKRVDAVVEIFRRIRADEARARLLLVGDGPDAHLARERLLDRGLMGSAEFLGEQLDIVSVLSVADLFLLPSSQESFGLAALEAMACEVPVVASRSAACPRSSSTAHGLPSRPGRPRRNGRGWTGAAARYGAAQRIAAAARQQVVEQFCTDVVVPRYEECYARLIGASARAGSAQTST